MRSTSQYKMRKSQRVFILETYKIKLLVYIVLIKTPIVTSKLKITVLDKV